MRICLAILAVLYVVFVSRTVATADARDPTVCLTGCAKARISCVRSPPRPDLPARERGRLCQVEYERCFDHCPGVVPLYGR